MKLLQLFRPRLALMNGISVLAGYLLFPVPAKLPAAVLLYAGSVLVAAGASALNQVQERHLDRLMARTRLRPVASGALSPTRGTVAGFAAVAGGEILVGLAGGYEPLLVGLLIVGWYLGVYTPLKRVTSLALPLGALCGALSPVMGWSAAGGAAADFRAVLVGGVFFLWQIPHFWLLQRLHREDYLSAGIRLFDPASGGPASYCVWLCALGAAIMLLPLFGLMPPRISFPLALCLLPTLLLSGPQWNRVLFHFVNCFPLAVTVSFFVGK